MKSVFCEVLALPKIGDELRICYRHKVRGGMTEAAIAITRDHFWRRLDDGETAGDREIWSYQPDPAVEPIVHVKMTDSESCAAVAATLASTISGNWTGELFSCKSRNNEIVITTNDDDVVFFPLLNGVEAAGRDVLTIE